MIFRMSTSKLDIDLACDLLEACKIVEESIPKAREIRETL
jgi:hypothetical protein